MKMLKILMSILGIMLILGGIGLMLCAGWHEALLHSILFHCGVPLGMLVIILGLSIVGELVEGQKSAYD